MEHLQSFICINSESCIIYVHVSVLQSVFPQVLVGVWLNFCRILCKNTKTKTGTDSKSPGVTFNYEFLKYVSYMYSWSVESYSFLLLESLHHVDSDDSRHHDDQTHREHGRLQQTEGDTRETL